MNNPVMIPMFEEKLRDSNFGNFEATIKSSSLHLEYASVRINCCNYEFHKKIIEAVQPILDELTVEMNQLLAEEGDKDE